jgi:hypothetical protein
MSEMTGILIGFLLTLFIYSFLVGDNPLYRLAVHVLVGVSAAYAAVVALRRIIVPVLQRLWSDPTTVDNLVWLVPLILSLLLLLKMVRSVSWAGNSATGILVTVGAAVALVGVITGTILPQVTASATGDPLSGVIAAVLTATALLYFQFTGRADREGNYLPRMWRRVVGAVGLAVLMVSFGAVYAGILDTSLSLLIERMNYYLVELTNVLGANL